MKKILVLFAFAIFINTNAQIQIKPEKIDQGNSLSFPKDQPVDVRLMFPDLDKGTEEYLKTNPNGLISKRLGKVAWDFTVGYTRYFWAADLTTTGYTPYQISATCKAVGNHCYIFVEDSNYPSRVTQAAVDSVKNAFDSKTPADPTRGIYQMDVDTFGDPTDKDLDPRIVILILDIRDGYTPGKSYTAGYFFGRDQTSDYGSNLMDIYYLDCNPLNLTTSSGLKSGMATTAHEFQHMINFHYKSGQELSFYNEGCSLVAELICGYTFREQTSFANDLPVALTTWRRDSGSDVLKDYSRAARFMLYMYDQFGLEFLKKYVQVQGLYSDSAIDYALSTISTNPNSRTYAQIIPDWYIANAIDNISVNPRWGYTKVLNMPKPQGSVYWNANVTPYSAFVPSLSAQIITHKGSTSLSSVFSNMNPTYHKIKAIKFGSGNPVVEDVPLNSTYNVPVLSPNLTSVQYLVLNSQSVQSNTPTNSQAFTYASTGTNPASSYEFKYDINTAAGSFSLPVGDSVCVYFDGVYSGKLDSIKVQFNKTGSLTANICEYTGSQQPTPNGKKLITNLAVNPVVVNAYNEWTKIDLRSYNINTSKAFTVTFPVLNTTNPAVMVSSYPSGGTSYHNYTYLADNPTPGWFYYTVTGDPNSVWVYHIRAYISVGTVGNEKTIEMLPNEFNLSQNYPNPFNPSTKIEFSLPELSRVTVKIYDMLGREVKTLINGEQSAGRHELIWNGDNEIGSKVATGVYMYTISTNKFTQTKKMLLLK